MPPSLPLFLCCACALRPFLLPFGVRDTRLPPWDTSSSTGATPGSSDRDRAPGGSPRLHGLSRAQRRFPLAHAGLSAPGAAGPGGKRGSARQRGGREKGRPVAERGEWGREEVGASGTRGALKRLARLTRPPFLPPAAASAPTGTDSSASTASTCVASASASTPRTSASLR